MLSRGCFLPGCSSTRACEVFRGAYCWFILPYWASWPTVRPIIRLRAAINDIDYDRIAGTTAVGKRKQHVEQNAIRAFLLRPPMEAAALTQNVY